MPTTLAALADTAEALAIDDVQIVVSPAGNDNQSGTAAAPLRTFAEAVRRLRPHWRKKQTVLLQPGTYTLPANFLVNLGHGIGAEAGPLVIQGSFTSQVGIRTVTQVTADSVVVSGDSLPAEDSKIPSDLVGSRLRFLTGPAANTAYLVAGTQQNLVTVNGVFAPKPAIGDTLVLERPAVSLEYPDGLVFTGSGVSQLYLIGLKFHPQSAGFFQFSGGLQVFAEGCEWDMNLGIFQVTERAILFSGGIGGTLPLRNTSTQSPSSGCFVHRGIAGGAAVDQVAGFRASTGSIDGYFVARDTGINVQDGSMRLNLSAKRCGLTVDGFYGGAWLEMSEPSVIEQAPLDAIQVSRDGHLKMTGVKIQNAGGSAVVVDEGSLALLQGVIGNGNGQYGLRADHGARVRVSASPATQVSGAKGQIQLAGNAHLWSQVPLSDPTSFARIEKA